MTVCPATAARLPAALCPRWIDQLNTRRGALWKRGRSDVGGSFATRTTVSGCHTKENGNYQTAGKCDSGGEELRRDVLETH